jgi:hypothetical protein
VFRGVFFCREALGLVTFLSAGFLEDVLWAMFLLAGLEVFSESSAFMIPKKLINTMTTMAKANPAKTTLYKLDSLIDTPESRLLDSFGVYNFPTLSGSTDFLACAESGSLNRFIPFRMIPWGTNSLSISGPCSTSSGSSFGCAPFRAISKVSCFSSEVVFLYEKGLLSFSGRLAIESVPMPMFS